MMVSHRFAHFCNHSHSMSPSVAFAFQIEKVKIIFFGLSVVQDLSKMLFNFTQYLEISS